MCGCWLTPAQRRLCAARDRCRLTHEPHSAQSLQDCKTHFGAQTRERVRLFWPRYIARHQASSKARQIAARLRPGRMVTQYTRARKSATVQAPRLLLCIRISVGNGSGPGDGINFVNARRMLASCRPGCFESQPLPCRRPGSCPRLQRHPRRYSPMHQRTRARPAAGWHEP